MGKRDFGNIKCLLHFDFPYFNEPNDGLDDDVGIATWSKENSNVALWGSEIPKAGTQAPKFGHRCLYPYKGSVISTNNMSIWKMNSSKDYEIEMFVYPKAHGGTRWLFQLTIQKDDSYSYYFRLSLTNTGTLLFACNVWGYSGTSNPINGSTILTTKTWHHILLRISNQKAIIFLDGKEEIIADLPANKTITGFTQVRLGYCSSPNSYPIFIDEFVFRHSAGSGAPTIPTRPYSGRLDISKIGGYGGYGTINSVATVLTSKSQLNSYGMISSIASSTQFTVSSWNRGYYSVIAGREIMIHITAPRSSTCDSYPLVGLYAFARAKSVSDTTVTLDRAISTTNGDDFTLDSSLLNTYYVQVISVNCFSSLTINSGVTVTPLTWSTTTGGGIVAFRTTGDCTINGNILTHGTGAIRYDYQQVTNSKLIDRFLCSQGGGIFISCGGTLTISSTARLGASWSGAGDGSNGAAGYGGRGGGVNPSSSQSASGGISAIGGGGGGAACSSSSTLDEGCAAGSSGGGDYKIGGGGGGCGGNGDNGTSYVGGSGGGGQGNSAGSGGTGKTNTNYPNGCNGNSGNGVNGGDYGCYDTNPYNSDSYTFYFSGAGGGAPGGNGGRGEAFKSASAYDLTMAGGIAGASIILIAKKLNVATEAISTGGAAGETKAYKSGYTKIGGSGGGGSGFCYIACEEQVS